MGLHFMKDFFTWRIDSLSFFYGLASLGLAVACYAMMQILRQSAARIRTSERRYRSLVDGSPNCVMLFDREGRCVTINKAGLSLIGCSEEEIIGKRFDRFRTHDTGRGIDELFAGVLKGEKHSFEAEGTRPDGKRLILNAVLNPVPGADGQIRSVVGIFMDISESKKAEDDLRKYYQRLEEMVMARTAELSEANERLNLINTALRDSEERFRSLFNLASDCILLIDAGSETLKIVDANITACVMNGYEYDELIGMPISALNDEEGRKKAPDLIKRIMSGGSVTFEVRHLRKDGGIFPVEVSAQLIHLSGRPYILAIERDISQRKKMEEKLMLFSKAVEETMDGIQITDLTGYIVYSNRAITEIYGYSQEELFGRHVNEMNVDPDYAGREIIPNIRKAGRWNGELMVRHKEGREFPVWLTASIIKDAKGEPLSMVGVVRDVTGRKKAEEELKRHREHLVEMVEERTVELKTAVQLLTNEINYRKMTEETLKESEAKFRKLSLEFNTVLDAMPDSLLLLSSDLRVMWANSAASSLLGREPSVLTGLHCFEMWYNRSEPCEDCFALRSFNTGTNENSQWTTPSGKLLDGRAFPIKGEEGAVNSVIIVLSDITEKTALQAEAMRASHLASLGELAAGVAHEINNPINGIINYAQILANKISAGSKENEIAQRIIREGDRIAGIVRGLLSFARERKEERITAAVQKIMEDTLTLTETQIRKDGIELLVNIQGGLPDIFANPQQIQQVFLNVISNARYALNQKYPGAQTEKKFLISVERIPIDNAPFVRATFYDTGTGISADIIDKVVHPFFSTKPSGLGTGLGLSISHGIIRSHGGRLAVESVEGAYTKVTIDLPAKERNGK
jgi:two-component system NtrC family sensor kinase